MRIAIVGAGTVGMHYAAAWIAAGHDVVLSFTRDRAALDERSAKIGATAAEPRAAAAAADVVVFSPPFELIAEAATQVGELDGVVVVDTTNPFTPERTGIVPLAEGRTAFLEVVAALPGARVVKALHNLGVAQVDEIAWSPVGFVAGGDDNARAEVAALVRDAGLTPVVSDSDAAIALSEAPGPLFMTLFTREDAMAALRDAAG